jgi:uncharacterized membrane protein
MSFSSRFLWALLMGILFASLFIPVVSAATIKGAVYNVFLDSLDRAIISINTLPEQTLVSQDGSYAFNAPPGKYTLIAVYDENGTLYSSSEQVIISDEGVYVIDLILSPEFGDEPFFGNWTEDEFVPYDTTPSSLGFAVSLVAILFFLLYLILNRQHFLREEHDHTHSPPTQQESNSEEMCISCFRDLVFL